MNLWEDALADALAEAVRDARGGGQSSLVDEHMAAKIEAEAEARRQRELGPALQLADLVAAAVIERMRLAAPHLFDL